MTSNVLLKEALWTGGSYYFRISKALIYHDENLKELKKDKLTTRDLELLNVKIRW